VKSGRRHTKYVGMVLDPLRNRGLRPAGWIGIIVISVRQRQSRQFFAQGRF
jgi:hypothetical protein